MKSILIASALMAAFWGASREDTGNTARAMQVTGDPAAVLLSDQDTTRQNRKDMRKDEDKNRRKNSELRHDTASPVPPLHPPPPIPPPDTLPRPGMR